jgi:4'-phosphopantetheinyl transferase
MGESRAHESVVVWTAFTTGQESDDELARLLSLVPADEATRSDRFFHRADRIRFLLARALARAALSRWAPLPPLSWAFRFNEHGRPELANRPAGVPDLRFNISHTDGLVACAVTVGREVGVDVEYIGRRLEYAVPERFFSPKEVSDLRSLPVTEQPHAFFDYWTLKEAYIKARGLGLALPLRHFTFIRRAGAAPAIEFAPELHDDPSSWQFAQFWPSKDHRMAVACRRSGEDLPIEVVQVDPGHLT